MTATEIACLCIGAAGILTALLSLPFFCRGRALSKKCSARTTGTVQRYRIGGGNRKAISPVVAYLVDGKPYTAYRHYKGVVTSHKSGASGAGNRLFVSEWDVLHIHTAGMFCNCGELAAALWPIGSTMPVVYNPRNPKQGFVEKPVSLGGTVGVTLLCTGVGLAVFAGAMFLLFQ